MDLELYNGVKIPSIGLGTWFIENDNARKIVNDAVEVGYRLIDTAQAYGNEKELGEGIKLSNFPREKLFITSKVRAEYKTYQETYDSVIESLNKLGLDYIDLMLIHSPEPWDKWRNGDHFFKGNIEAWRALEDLYKEGKLRSIGVSNFEIVDLENIIKNCKIKPMVNQLLVHIGNTPFELINYCKKNDILVEAYSPIAHGEILDDPILLEMAKKYNKSVAQLSLKYVSELGLVALPKATSTKHLKDNFDFDFEISKEDFETLKSFKEIENYGKHSYFPVFSKKKD